ncbi:hypothetical protein C8R43DRAFT_820739, partial [Mycena crocata]
LESLFRWRDGWRATFPDTDDYTCVQLGTDRLTNNIHESYSRLDRVNVDNQKFKDFRGWEIKHCPVKSDHRLVLTQLTCRPDQRSGPGRLSMPAHLLKTSKFMNRVQTLAAQLVKDLESLERLERNPANNIQHLWAKFKLGVTSYGKHCSRFITDETTRNIRNLEAQLRIVLHDQDMAPEDRSL